MKCLPRHRDKYIMLKSGGRLMISWSPTYMRWSAIWHSLNPVHTWRYDRPGHPNMEEQGWSIGYRWFGHVSVVLQGRTLQSFHPWRKK